MLTVSYSAVQRVSWTAVSAKEATKQAEMVRTWQMYALQTNKNYRELNFNTTHGEEGGPSDRPLIVQVCSYSSQLIFNL